MAYREKHEHGAGTGVYLNYMPSSGKREDDWSRTMDLRVFLPLSGSHDASVHRKIRDRSEKNLGFVTYLRPTPF